MLPKDPQQASQHVSLKMGHMRASWRLSSKESTCQCRRHMFDPWAKKIPHAVEQLSPCATTIEPVLSRVRELQLWKPSSPRACALQQEKPPEWEAHTLQLESSPHSLQLEKSLHSNQDSVQPKINKYSFFFFKWVTCPPGTGWLLVGTPATCQTQCHLQYYPRKHLSG